MNIRYKRLALLISVLLTIETVMAQAAFADEVSDAETAPQEEISEEQAPPEPEEEEPVLELDEEQPSEEPEPEVKNGWITENGKRYYYVDGTALTGMQKIEKAWYYFLSDGAMVTGWKTISESRYYFDPETGKRQHGKETINGYVYFFDEEGKMHTGWLKKSGKRFYHTKKGKRVFGGKKIGKYKYYFSKKTGAMKKGWLKLKGKRYYYNKKGHKLFGVQKIGGKTYYLNLTTGARMPKGKYFLYKKIWYKSSRTKYLVYVDKKGKYVNVYKGKAKHWTLKKRVRCSIGAPGTPTPSGTFRMCSKVYHFGEGKGYTCWYASGFIGTTYLMHAVVCYRGTKTPSDGRLGLAISHGCVRMKMSNAKWIYDNVPIGTTVLID